MTLDEAREFVRRRNAAQDEDNAHHLMTGYGERGRLFPSVWSDPDYWVAYYQVALADERGPYQAQLPAHIEGLAAQYAEGGYNSTAARLRDLLKGAGK